ncbi:TIGR03086 family protein [Streptomyces spongiicola]|uniref:TIGR03086 family protein n=1 Tax=Streptomyces spongiicola TaxID=1690221 RepID=A0A2S1Z6W0_9ACTN|nr:TIGR03086 family metal-binding protein [Streptomyces spongiicola]AWK12085.1 TIGR03086 family protein [Streptomyces spongiicola]GBQ02663.1 TIGR03086 family protein [Streptomyces spongiicola]
MDNRLLDRHAEALALFTERVHAVRPEQWEAPTPCTGWSVRDLVNHVTAEQLWVPSLVGENRSITDVGDSFDGDVLGGHPAVSWDRAASAAKAAFHEPGALDRTVGLSYGESTAAAYCSQMTTDMIVHAWDLSRGIGTDDTLPGALVDFAAGEVAPYAAELSGSGLFAPPVEPPEGADPQARLLCLLGRRP